MRERLSSMSEEMDIRDQDVDSYLVEIFEREIMHQWDIAARSISMMNLVLRRESQDVGLFWFGLDAALGALGNISKIFFPLGKLDTNSGRRRAYMRQLYGITDHSLLRSRDARNGFEHFDERLDRWFRNSTRKNFADRNISEPDDISGLESIDFARHFDPKSNTVTVFGVALDFQALVLEVKSIIDQVQSRQACEY